VTIVRSHRVVLPDGVRAASIHVSDGRITRIADHHDITTYDEVVDVGELVVSPGLVDTHVHVNEPGRTEWEGFETATSAAAAGGITTLVDMPLNCIPATTSLEGLRAKREAARGRCSVDVAFWGGVVPGNTRELEGLVDAGVCGFKCFLVPSGVDEFGAVNEDDLRRALPILARRNVPLLVHAESPRVLAAAAVRPPDVIDGDDRSYFRYLATRPPEAEIEAIRMMVRLADEFAVLTHIVHVAAAGAVDELARAQQAGVPITAETCPHYLTFDAESIADGATLFKCAPPVREAVHREALWDGLRAGVLGVIATDHSPAPPEMKPAGDFTRAWGGIASLEVSLAAAWSGASVRGFGVSDLARWMSLAPAALAALSDRKGAIAVGRDADLVVWDPDGELVVDPCSLQQRHKLTPYAGMRLRGIVRRTYLRGRLVWDRDEWIRRTGTSTTGRTGHAPDAWISLGRLL
jgi:allantoinase